MSEGVFLLPRVFDDQSGNGVALLKNKRITTAFGTAGTNISVKQGRLYKICVNNTAAATKYYVMIFDKATAPVNGDTPIHMAQIAAGADWSEHWNLHGLYVTNGIGLAISTTPNTLTLAASNDAYAFADYTQVT